MNSPYITVANKYLAIFAKSPDNLAVAMDCIQKLKSYIAGQTLQRGFNETFEDLYKRKPQIPINMAEAQDAIKFIQTNIEKDNIK